jgi:UDP-N-acetylmuramoyl-tripeptide--D-alanyl-D-alanine ligase
MQKHLALFVLNYLRLFAKIQILKLRILNPKLKIIGVTGSAGKSSAIYAIDHVLSSRYNTITTKNYNSESGIPLSLLKLKITNYSIIDWLKILLLAPLKLISSWQKIDFIIVEMGIDSNLPPKNMDYLLSIIKPDIGVFLSLSTVHMANFENNIDNIGKEKAKLINSLPASGYAIFNPNLKKYIHTKAKIIKIKSGIQTKEIASAIGKLFRIKADFTNLQLPPSRCSILKGKDDSTIIDSSYNSSLVAATEMLKLLKDYPSPRIAILGDMREIGKTSKEEHEKLYKIAQKNADIIIGVGIETKKIFKTNYKYWWQIPTNFPKKSTILVKGSQNTIYLEEFVKKILKNKLDKKLLCRQSPYWQKTKQDFKNKNYINQSNN